MFPLYRLSKMDEQRAREITAFLCKGWPSRTQIGGVSNDNYKRGIEAEKYVLNKVRELSPKYYASMTLASKTPADIIAFSGRRSHEKHGFFHIMLIQVKSTSKEPRNLQRGSKKMGESLFELGKFVKKKLVSGGVSGWKKQAPFIISLGYAGVITNKTGLYLVTRKPFKMEILHSVKNHISKEKRDEIIGKGHSLLKDVYA